MNLPARRSSRPLRAALPLTALLLLAPACGDDVSGSPDLDAAASSPTASDGASDDAPTAQDPTSDEPATDEVAGDGYRFALPDGWSDATDQFRAMEPDVDTGAVDQGSAGSTGFANNLNVLVSPFTGDDIAAGERQFRTEVESFAQNVTVHPRAEIDGREAVHVGATMSSQGERVDLDQYGVPDEDGWYVLTFSVSAELPRAERDAVVSELLAGWSWED